jgi:hypothetical protein
MSNDEAFAAQQTVLGLLDTLIKRGDASPALTALQCGTRACSGEADLWFDLPGEPATRLLVALTRNGDSCHACAPALSLARFEHSDGGWRLRTLQPFFTLSGSWGDFSGEMSMLPVSASRYALVITDGFTAQGVTSRRDRLFLPSGGLFREVCCDVNRDYSNAGAGTTPSLSWQGTLEALPDSGRSPYDLRYRLQGQMNGSHGVEEIVLRYQDGGYKPVEPLPQWMP